MRCVAAFILGVLLAWPAYACEPVCSAPYSVKDAVAKAPLIIVGKMATFQMQMRRLGMPPQPIKLQNIAVTQVLKGTYDHPFIILAAQGSNATCTSGFGTIAGENVILLDALPNKQAGGYAPAFPAECGKAFFPIENNLVTIPQGTNMEHISLETFKKRYLDTK